MREREITTYIDIYIDIDRYRYIQKVDIGISIYLSIYVSTPTVYQSICIYTYIYIYIYTCIFRRRLRRHCGGRRGGTYIAIISINIYSGLPEGADGKARSGAARRASVTSGADSDATVEGEEEVRT